MAAKLARGKSGMNGLDGRDGRDSRPVPDPTIQTAILVDRATAALREILEAQIKGDRSVLETRLSGMDEAIKLLQIILDRRSAETDVKVDDLRVLHDEKFQTTAVRFESVQTQFLERDVRGRDAALANTTAVNAALQAQKEAAGEQAKSFTLSIDKSEKGTLEQIAQQRVLLETMKQGMDGKVDDLKERLTRIESAAVGSLAAVTENRAVSADSRGVSGSQVGMISLGISLIAIIILVAEKVIGK